MTWNWELLAKESNEYIVFGVLQQMIKELCSQRPPHLNISYFSLVLNDVHLLTPLAQHALRRTMETHSRRCRMIMHCTNLSKASFITRELFDSLHCKADSLKTDIVVSLHPHVVDHRQPHVIKNNWLSTFV